MFKSDIHPREWSALWRYIIQYRNFSECLQIFDIDNDFVFHQ